MVEIGASGTYYTYDDRTYQNLRITKYGNGILSFSSYKAPLLTSSYDVLSVAASVSQDLSLDADTYYNEIPRRTYVSSSRPTSLIDKKKYNYKYSPQSNINFRRIDRDQKGYSRTYRSSSRDYSDDFYASRSLINIPERNSYYYGEGQSAYSSSGEFLRINREKPSDKFYSDEIGNPQWDAFRSYGSGSVSGSWEYVYGVDRKVKNRVYYLNEKKEIPWYYHYWDPLVVRYPYNEYGSAYDSTKYSLRWIAYNPLPITGDLWCQCFNENWGSGSDSNSYVAQYKIASGSSSRSYGIGTTIYSEKGTTNALASWYCSGKSGSLDLYFNNKSLEINGEEVVPNVAVLRAYPSNGAFTSASVGTGISGSSTCWGDAGKYYSVYQSTASFIINSCDCPFSAPSLFSYHDFIFSINYPLVDESYVSSYDSFFSSKGLVLGIFFSYWATPTNHIYMLPIINYSIDGNIKMISVDKDYNLVFKNSGRIWENNTLYKTSIFADLSNRKFTELMINDEYVSRIELSNIIGAVVKALNPNLAQPKLIDSSVLTALWSFMGCIDTNDYDEYQVYTIRCAKGHYYQGKVYNTVSDFDRYKLVNRFNKINIYNGQLRKKYSGALNTGIKLMGIDSIVTPWEDDNVAIEVSSSISDFSKRALVHPIEYWNKLFLNNQKKTWFFDKRLFPRTSGY